MERRLTLMQGTARWLRGQGFSALATTSAGFAFTQGRADQDVGLDLMLAQLASLSEDDLEHLLNNPKLKDASA